MHKVTYIEEYVVPQLFTMAIEAYEFEHQGGPRSKGRSQLETFGLLWGYSIPQKGELPARVIATMATVETSATRHQDWVAPNFESVIAKKSSSKNIGRISSWSARFIHILTAACPT